jgi:hypothetical protein
MSSPEEGKNKSLETAYSRRSYELLRQFLDDWSYICRPDTSRFSRSKLFREVYDAYEAFYEPKNYDSLFLKTDARSLTSLKYLVVQDRLTVLVVDDKKFAFFSLVNQDAALRKAKKVIITDFCPFLKTSSSKPLYLTERYKKIISSFLESQWNSEGRIETVHDIGTKDRVLDKVRFLKKFMRIYPSHWGDFWIVETEPYVDSIVIDSTFDVAVIYYSINSQIGECRLKKESNKWVIMRDSIVGSE